jgi:asparagine synthetase B (glutamine-hydrolysing)
MPGISGYVSGTGPLANANELMQRIETVHALPKIEWVTKRIQTDRAVITNMLTGLWTTALDQPATDPAESCILFLEGQLFNWEEISRLVNEQWAESPCEQLLALFLKHGPEFISLLDGEFNLLIYQPDANRLLIFNDQLSSKPFYYLVQPQGLLFGSEK